MGTIGVSSRSPSQVKEKIFKYPGFGFHGTNSLLICKEVAPGALVAVIVSSIASNVPKSMDTKMVIFYRYKTE